MKVTTTRALQHYFVGGVLFALYGIQVCPFLDTLSPIELFVPIVACFMMMLVLRTWLVHLYDGVALKYVTERQFWTDFGLFGMSGLVLAALNTVYYQFPLESSLKVWLGMFMLGFFISCELALYTRWRLNLQIASEQTFIQPDDNPVSLTRKFSFFSAGIILTIGIVIFLVINKDLSWLRELDQQITMQHAQYLIIGEIAFILAIICAYSLLIILAYTRNLRFFLNHQNQVLDKVSQGLLTARVPVTSNDEFGMIAHRTNHMIVALEQRTAELNQTRDVAIMALAILAETRDNETGSHILRTQHYVRILAEELSKEPKFSQVLLPDAIEDLFKSAPLHDVGKVGIPDAILLKPGKLTAEEFEIMQQHPQIGFHALKIAEDRLGSNSFLACARQIALTHHEKWDGSGYPQGLKGEQIPLAGRLMALADVFDALISKRVYKQAFSYEKTRELIVQGRGTHFDPDVVDAYIRREADFIAIAQQYYE